MAEFRSIEAISEGSAIRLRFSLDVPATLGWQAFDPASGVFLFEGEWLDVRGTDVNLRLDLPAGDGPYRVQVAPVEDRRRFILIQARVEDGNLQIDGAPVVVSASALRWQRLLRALPKAFTYPVRSVRENHRLMRSMVRRDILSRYRGSAGGALWTVLNPLLLMATYFFVFGIVLKQRFAGDSSRSGFVLYFLAGMLPWLAFSEAVGRSPYVILEHRNFVKKLVFPLETLPVNLVISGAVTEAFALLIFVVFLLAARGAIPMAVAWLPALLLPQLLLTAGLCWFLAALGIFFRDLGQITGFVLTLWFFLTPICYQESNAIPRAAARILELNPILVLVRGYRAIFLEGHAPALPPLMALWIGSCVIAVLGHAWFHRLRRSFADVI
ncbi:MAG: ABC transporter permease [Bryobacterales bacterium]|nr:ABC transporter permease [Bryobacterales bacterium]MBV9399021.1 ABC transporter permease [Bryobacterales bacterium]